MSMSEPDVSKPSPCEGDGEKRDGGPERGPAVVVFMSKKPLWSTFGLIWLTKFFMLVVETIVLRLTPHVMSHFSESSNSVPSVLPLVIQISSGILRIPTAKFVDEFGRDFGFFMAWCLAMLGLLIHAGAQSLTATAVAQTFWGIGSSCLDCILTIVLADMTSLKNRALIYGIYATPVFFTTLVAPNTAESLRSQLDWRAVYGICAGTWYMFVGPTSVILLFAKAKLWADDQENGATTRGQESRLRDRLKRFTIELDILGVILAFSGLSLMILAFANFPGTQEDIAFYYVMSSIGALSLVCFIFWEMFLAPVTCFPWRLMRDRNLLGGCLVVMLSAASITYWASYYDSYLQVIYDTTVTTAGSVTMIRLLTSSLTAPMFGLLLRDTGCYKHPALVAGTILAITTGLLLVLNGKEASPVVFQMFQAVLGPCERLLLACSQIAVMANIDHEHVALALGIWGTFLSVAVAIGSSGATAIWTEGLQAILEDALPADSKNLTGELMDSLEKQKQYPLGSPVRDAVIAAYRLAQKHVLIAAATLMPLAFVSIFMWRNINLRKCNDAKGARARGVIW